MKKIASTLALLLAATWAVAQGPPPPPPLPPLVAPAAPAGNPVTTDKANLGKALFWDEQLSSTRTVSCGSCHQPASGGSDPRSLVGETDHPGADGIFGTDDDVTGSPGVISNNADGTYTVDDFFGLAVQTTGRYAPSAINAGFADELFWDGRAGEEFVDPVSGSTVLASGAALESQVAGPPTSPVEMSHTNRDWEEVAERIGNVKPLAVSPDIPTDLESWISGRNYDELFTQAFGSSGVTASRIIMAIATYERTLVSNQAPFDALIAGNPNALTPQEQQGLNLFRANDCVACHGGNRLTDDQFHYIGVRPRDEDLGRFNVTGANPDRGRMKTPSLRNVELRGEFMHNGRFQTLAEVVDFYDRGGDFDAPNKNANVRPLNLTDVEKAALVAFLGRPLTDPRVTAETGIFSRPALFADSPLSPVIGSDGVNDSDGQTPRMIAVEPSLAGNPSFTVALETSKPVTRVFLAIDTEPIPSGAIPSSDDVSMLFDIYTDDDGHASVVAPIPGGTALSNVTLYGKWFITGEGGPDGESASFSAATFGESAGLLGAPINLSGSYDTNTGFVDLTWDAVTDADSYELYRGTSGNFAEANRLGSSDTNGFTDTSALVDEVYHYSVFAVNDHEASDISAPATVSTIDLSGFTLNVTDGTSTEETQLSWPGQGVGLTYVILRGDEPDPRTMTVISGDQSTVTFNDASGEAAKTYYYRVVAKSGASTVANSEVVGGSRSLAPPTNLSATHATLDDRIRISWTGEDDADSYRIYRSSGSSFVDLDATSATVYDDFAAIAATSYSYKVVSVNAHGESIDSEIVSGFKQVQAPRDVTASFADFLDQITVSWTLAESVNHYRIYRSSTGSFSDAVLLDTVSDDSSFSDTTAASGVNYTYWVASVDEESESIVDEAAGSIGLAGDATPDAMIGKTSGSVKGDNIYNTTGAGQNFNASTKRYRNSKATFVIQNDGSISDVLVYSGTGKTKNFNVKYIRTSPVPTNLTAAMKTGNATSAALAPAAGEQITIKISPKRSRTKRGKTLRYNGALTSVSSIDPGEIDCVKLKVTASK